MKRSNVFYLKSSVVRRSRLMNISDCSHTSTSFYEILRCRAWESQREEWRNKREMREAAAAASEYRDAFYADIIEGINWKISAWMKPSRGIWVTAGSTERLFSTSSSCSGIQSYVPITETGMSKRPDCKYPPKILHYYFTFSLARFPEFRQSSYYHGIFNQIRDYWNSSLFLDPLLTNRRWRHKVEYRF